MEHSQNTLTIRFSAVDGEAYRVDLEGPERAGVRPPAQEEGVTLEQLLGYVAQACPGDTELGQRL